MVLICSLQSPATGTEAAGAVLGVLFPSGPGRAGAGAARELGSLVATLDLRQAHFLTKTFATYFQLVNIAE